MKGLDEILKKFNDAFDKTFDKLTDSDLLDEILDASKNMGNGILNYTRTEEVNETETHTEKIVTWTSKDGNSIFRNIKRTPKKDPEADIRAEIEVLEILKKQAVDREDYLRADELKKEIAELESKLKSE